MNCYCKCLNSDVYSRYMAIEYYGPAPLDKRYYERQVAEYALKQADESTINLAHPTVEQACQLVGDRTFLKLKLASKTCELLSTGFKIEGVDYISEQLKVMWEKATLDEIRSGDFRGAIQSTRDDRSQLFIGHIPIARGLGRVLSVLPEQVSLDRFQYQAPSDPPWMNFQTLQDYLNRYKRQLV